MDFQTAKRIISYIWMTLEDFKEGLNDINVFPVADGDTGKNMAKTMQGAVDELNRLPENANMLDFWQAVRKGVFAASSGNSGTILSTYIMAFCDVMLQDYSEQCFQNALRQAANKAYTAISQPKSGTILNVMQDLANAAVKVEASKGPQYLLKILTDTAYDSVANTTHQMELLEKHRTVDSGALGLAIMVEAIYRQIRRSYVKNDAYGRAKQWLKFKPNLDIERHTHEQVGKYGYCTLYLFEAKEAIDAEAFLHEMRKIGDSEVLIRDGNKYKLHVHTNNPKAVERRIRKIGGEVLKKEISDMRTQANDRLDRIEEAYSQDCGVAIITDSTCDLPPEVLMKTAIDCLEVEVTDGKTVAINESRWYDAARRNLAFGRDVLIISFSSKLSSTYDNAAKAAKKLQEENPDQQIIALDSKTTSIGLGYLVLLARQALSSGWSLARTANRIDILKQHIHIYAVIEDLDYLYRGGRLKKNQQLLLKLTDRRPVIFVTKDGALEVFGTVPRRKAIDFLTKQAKKSVNKTVSKLIGVIYSAGGEATARLLERGLEAQLGKPKAGEITEIGAVVSAHTGPKVVAFVVLGKRKK
ncbi:MAG: DegV family EDD domain-containing protein [Candidatus Nomurabacteria bacterium]|jgi:DegV family protein with EDD domain|nr:DegV family EDD domain-containing protein [Candidatus Nomurabacteria bacterium]